MMRKAQSALEFLTTYGWMLIILVVVMVVLTFFGMFNPPKPSVCTFPANFVCRGWKLTADGNMTLDLYQNTGHNINVRGVNCTKAIDQNNPQFIGMDVYIRDSDHERIGNGTNIRCLDANGIPVSGNIGSSYSGKLALYYIENDTFMPHVIVGDITFKYE